VVERTLPLLDAAPTPEEKLHYLMCLRLVKTPWIMEQRKAYFAWLQRAEQFPGAHYMPRFVQFIRQDAIATLSAAEKTALGELLEPLAVVGSTTVAPPRPFVKAWTLDDFSADLDRARDKPSAEQGQQLFVAAECAKCHRVGPTGALVGPDLTGVGKRFSQRDVLLSILEPSRVIDDKYKQRTITTTRGVTYTGQQLAADDEGVSLITDPTQPTRVTRIAKAEIEENRPSTLSPMPAGMLNTLSKDEVLALLDFLTK
jgi:putative heme-binding domain-containing protein